MANHFFAILSRMKYIERWSLMRSARRETLSEHSLEVAMIAHALCVIANKRFGHHTDPERAALIGIYHDAAEIITGDLPTPVKYARKSLKDAYSEIESAAEEKLLSELPEDLRKAYEDIFAAGSDPEEVYMRRLVKAADKLSALIKCTEEETAGNMEFTTAMASTGRSLLAMAEELPEVQLFMEEFLPSYGRTLDELLSRE